MIDDATVFRLGAGQLPLRRRRRVRRHLAEGAGGEARPAGLGQAVDRPAAQPRRPGAREPRAPAEIVWTPPTQPSLEELKWFRFTIGRIGGYDGIPIVVSRTGYTGELGYEVWCHPTDGPAVWDAIWQAGAAARAEAARPRGARHPAHRVGPDLRRLRVRRPGRPVRGRDPVRRQPRHGGRLRRPGGARGAARPTRSACSSASSSPATRPPATATRVYVGRQRVGVVTSGTRSPILQEERRALPRLAVQFRELGTEVEVGKLDGLQKRIPATVVRFPFYDPDKTRPRA